MIISVKTGHRTQMIDITDQVRRVVKDSGVRNGLVHIFSMHTTGAVTINENADPAVPKDILNTINKIVPWDDRYMHMEGNSAAHIKVSLFGPSEMVALENGSLVLGTWQSIFFCEFDGPRQRKVNVTIMSAEG
jgi:secondary thiamine-phosphate synthase enzyme